MIFEESFIFFPSRYPQGQWDVPELDAGADTPLVFEDCHFQADDGVNLHGWFSTLRGANPNDAAGHEYAEHRPTLLWFHGNAGHLADRVDKLRSLTHVGMDVLVVDYRGYGRSEGKPHEAGLYLDARAAWRYLTQERSVAPRRIVILGVSLGGAVAVDLAQHVDAAGLIVESSFTNIVQMAQLVMPWVPRSLIRSRMDSLSKVATLTLPKLFIHGEADEVVPVELGRKLHEAAAEPKQYLEIPLAGHNDLTAVAGLAYDHAIKAFCDQVTDP